MSEFLDREPLHLPAAGRGRRAELFDWPRFNAMLSRASCFTPHTLRLVRDGEPIPAEQYCVPERTPQGEVLQPSPAKVEVLLSTGASLVANEVQTMTPEIADLAAMLGRAFAARVGVNAYCSFGGVQAFGVHFDLHDVFAVQIEGRKRWRLYQSRAEAPVAFPAGSEAEVRKWFEATRGPLREEILLQPGDVLYLPRGWYHEAMADAPASLHLTFSVTPQTGRAVLDLLVKAAMQGADFRAFVPPAHLNGGEALAGHLAALGRRLAELASLPEFRDEVAMGQERLVLRPAAYSLPERKPLTLFRPTGLVFASAGPAGLAMDWAFRQPSFALEDLVAEFDFLEAGAVRQAVLAAEAAGALKRL